jgi:hypothetical protein
MNAFECPHEQDLLDAIQASRWPDRAEAALTAHVAGCAVCRDVATVAPAFMGGTDGPVGIHVPEAGAVWLRAQWRARAEAERLATHPITAAQAAAIGCVAAISGALFGATSAWFQGGLVGLAGVFAKVGAWLPTTVSADGVFGLVAAHATLAVGTAVAVLLVLLAPVAAYVVTRE